MALENLAAEDEKRLREIIEEGVRMRQRHADEKGGLSDVIKEFSKKLDLKPKVLNRAIAVAFKNSMTDVEEETDYIKIILDKANKL